MTTALDKLTNGTAVLPNNILDALRLHAHPQERTKLFHSIFNAPIFDPSDGGPDQTFSHMDDARVAFRVSFLLSEIFELMEDGLGLQVAISVRSGAGGPTFGGIGSDNAQLNSAVLKAMAYGTKRDLVGIVDALGDINVVNNGFAVELGVNMPAVDQEILASNLTKLGADGLPIVADGSDPKYPAGKILKGPDYVAPQIAELLGFSGSD